MIGATRCGSTCERMIRPSLAPDHPGGLDELLLSDREHLGAHDPRRVEPAEEAEDEDERHHPLAEYAERDLVQPGADRAASAMTKSRTGNAMVISVTREMTVSIQPL